MQRGALVNAMIATWLILAEASASQADSAFDPAQDGCFQRSAVRDYLERVQDRTLDRWMLPSGIGSNHKVSLAFRIAADGAASDIKVLKTTNKALGVSAVAAMQDAEPFLPLPDDADCLEGIRIVATFSNPVPADPKLRCGLGFELVLVLPLLAWLRRRGGR
jgi:hypothetical protein